ncbi:hypothetical protein C8R46DRAFT_1144899 [Mycena filopes]|nr:hypothetical protein C8R46DRAFT_1144899 [Mycena filopes]
MLTDETNLDVGRPHTAASFSAAALLPYAHNFTVTGGTFNSVTQIIIILPTLAEFGLPELRLLNDTMYRSTSANIAAFFPNARDFTLSGGTFNCVTEITTIITPPAADGQKLLEPPDKPRAPAYHGTPAMSIPARCDVRDADEKDPRRPWIPGIRGVLRTNLCVFFIL